MKSNKSRRLGFENLESRNLMAGNVLVSVSEGVLSITGDSADNRFTIQQLPGNNPGGVWAGARYKISQPWVPPNQAPTTFNGQESVIVEGVKHGLEMNTGAGNDLVDLYGVKGNGSFAQVPGVVNIDMGSGGDLLRPNIENHNRVDIQLGKEGDGLIMAAKVHALNVLGDPVFNPEDPPVAPSNETMKFWLTAGGPVTIDTKYGNDEITLIRPQSISSKATFEILTGSGHDDIAVFSPTESVIPHLRIDTGDGDDRVTAQQLVVGGNLVINSGRGNDVVSVGIVTVSGNLRVWAGQGNDHVRITTDVIASQTTLAGGDGTDVLEIGKDRGNDLGDQTISGFETMRDI